MEEEEGALVTDLSSRRSARRDALVNYQNNKRRGAKREAREQFETVRWARWGGGKGGAGGGVEERGHHIHFMNEIIRSVLQPKAPAGDVR